MYVHIISRHLKKNIEKIFSIDGYTSVSNVAIILPYLKRVTFTPAVCPRSIDSLHLDIQSTGIGPGLTLACMRREVSMLG